MSKMMFHLQICRRLLLVLVTYWSRFKWKLDLGETITTQEDGEEDEVVDD